MASDAVVNLVVNAAGADARITAQMRAIVNDAERRAPEINLRVDLDTGRLERRLERELNILGTRLNSSLGAVNTSIQDGFRDMTNQLSADLRQLSQRMNAVNNNIVTVNSSVTRLGHNDGIRRVADDADDADRSTDRLGDTFRRLGGRVGNIALLASKMTLVAGAASGAVPVVAGLVTAVESILPAAAAGVTAFVGMKAAALTLKVGLSGVEEAISAVFDPNADPEAVSEALEHLSKNARSFVLELQKLKPALSDLRLDVQDRLFKGLDKTIASVGKTTIPVLRTAALDFAAVFNSMAKDVGKQAQELSESGQLGQALKSGSDAFANLERIPGQVLNAIVKLSIAGGPLLDKLTTKIADVADSLTEKIDKAFASGSLEKSVSEAGKTLAQLGRIAHNVFEGVSNILGVANDSGYGLFGTLEKLTQGFADVTASDSFQQTLNELISLIETVVVNALPLLGSAFEAFQLVVSELAPVLEEIVTRLADELQPLFEELAPTLGNLAELFGEILLAVLPLVEDGLEILIDVMPRLNELITAFRDLVKELAPVIDMVGEGLQSVLGPAIDIIIMALIGWVDIMRLTVIGIKQLVDWFTEFTTTLQDIVAPAIDIIAMLLRGDFSGAFNAAKQVVMEMVNTAIGYFTNLKDQILTKAGEIAGGVVRWARQGFGDFAQRAAQMKDDVIGYFRGLRDQAISIVSGMAPGLYQAGANMISSLISGIRSQFSGVMSAVNDIVSAARDFLPFSPAKRGPLSGRGYPLYSGQAFVDSFAQGITSRKGSLENALSATLGSSLAASGLATDVSVSGGLSASAGALSAAARTAGTTVSPPAVSVYLGNELVRNYVTTIVHDNNAARDRLAAQGTRV